MTIQDWLQQGKPANVPFTIQRRIELPKEDEVEQSVNLLAKLILDSVKHYTDNNFRFDPLSDLHFILSNPYLFTYDNYLFAATVDGPYVTVGAVARKLT